MSERKTKVKKVIEKEKTIPARRSTRISSTQSPTASTSKVIENTPIRKDTSVSPRTKAVQEADNQRLKKLGLTECRIVDTNMTRTSSRLANSQHANVPTQAATSTPNVAATPRATQKASAAKPNASSSTINITASTPNITVTSHDNTLPTPKMPSTANVQRRSHRLGHNESRLNGTSQSSSNTSRNPPANYNLRETPLNLNFNVPQDQLQMDQLREEDDSDTGAELLTSGPIVTLCREESFSASHRLHNPKLSTIENKKIFGKCNNLNGHGHNYRVKVHLKGRIKKKTGMVYNIADLKEEMKVILNDLDHQNLDKDVPFFENNVSTAENIAAYFLSRLRDKMNESYLLYKVELWETDKNSVCVESKDVPFNFSHVEQK